MLLNIAALGKFVVTIMPIIQVQGGQSEEEEEEEEEKKLLTLK